MTAACRQWRHTLACADPARQRTLLLLLLLLLLLVHCCHQTCSSPPLLLLLSGRLLLLKGMQGTGCAHTHQQQQRLQLHPAPKAAPWCVH
jgi:hypothetical protein